MKAWSGVRPTAVYLMRCLGRYKIGVSGSPESRAKALSRGMPEQVDLVDAHWFESQRQAFLAERAIHKALQRYCTRYEWFKFESQPDLHQIISDLGLPPSGKPPIVLGEVDRPEECAFLASVPAVAAAISKHGSGRSGRLSLDVPPDIVDTLAWYQATGEMFEVVITPLGWLDEDEQRR